MKGISARVGTVAVTLMLLLGGCDATPAPAAPESDALAPEPSAVATPANPGEQSNPSDSPAPAKGTGLCAPREEVLFSCQLDNGKIASICGVENSAEAIVAQYRYGGSGQEPELTSPDADGPDRLKFASVPYSGGGEAQLQFRRGDTLYIVYSRVIRTNFAAGQPNDPALEDGVLVRKDGRTIARHACAGPDVAPIDYEKAENYAEQSADGVVDFEN
mgnify:FL=1|tara:strand:+ start:427 stop:1077 length:651 start_codon:yes stop_codon:yes gene_type:complete